MRGAGGGEGRAGPDKRSVGAQFETGRKGRRRARGGLVALVDAGYGRRVFKWADGRENSAIPDEAGAVAFKVGFGFLAVAPPDFELMTIGADLAARSGVRREIVGGETVAEVLIDAAIGREIPRE